MNQCIPGHPKIGVNFGICVEPPPWSSSAPVSSPWLRFLSSGPGMNHPQRHSRGWRIPGTTVPVMSRGALATSTAETASWGPSVQNTSTRTTKTCCENLSQNCGRFTWLSLNTHWAKRGVMRNATAAVHEGLWSFDPNLSYGRNKWTSPRTQNDAARRSSVSSNSHTLRSSCFWIRFRMRNYHLVMTFTVCHGKSPPCY